jgi:integrase
VCRDQKAPISAAAAAILAGLDRDRPKPVHSVEHGGRVGRDRRTQGWGPAPEPRLRFAARGAQGRPPRSLAINPQTAARIRAYFELGLDHGYLAHSTRATFITTALENGAQLEDVQKAAGHRDPGTTKLYDRRSYNPEEAASFLATY